MAAWTLHGLGVKFGPSSFFFYFFFKKPAFFFFFFVWVWIGLINKSCVSVMAVLKFLLYLYLIFFLIYAD